MPTTTTADLTTQTPVEIDTQLAAIYQRLWSARSHLDYCRDRIRRADNQGRRHTVGMVEDHLSAKADVEALEAEAAPLEDEYLRRGRWTRAFLVQNAGGHVHSTMACGTCYASTRFAWLPEVSGQDEAEIVRRAGSDACTVCYPSAPVNDLKRPRSLFTKDEVAAQAEREARAAAKVEREAKRLKAALLPDGRELILTLDGYRERVSTLSTAKRLLTDAYWWEKDTSGGDYRMLIAHIAVKEGKSTNQVIEEAKKRAAKRR